MAAIEKVRERTNGERGHGRQDTCRCGRDLVFVAELSNGAKIFYWCWVCDTSTKRR